MRDGTVYSKGNKLTVMYDNRNYIVLAMSLCFESLFFGGGQCMSLAKQSCVTISRILIAMHVGMIVLSRRHIICVQPIRFI